MSSGCALYRENGDFLFIRKCICGFSRESLVAVTTDIESRELRQRTNMEDGLLPEHPCASTMDNVECFFSMPHDYIGKYFTAKLEFQKMSQFTILNLHTTVFMKAPSQPRPRETKNYTSCTARESSY